MADKTVITTGNSSNLYSSTEKPADMLVPMYQHYPSISPLLSISTKLSTGVTSQSRVDFTEQEELPDTIVITAAVAAGATPTLVSTQYTYVRPYDVWYCPRTDTRFLITETTFLADADGNIVSRVIGGSPQAALVGGDILRKIGVAFPDGTLLIQPQAVLNSTSYNLTQETTKYTRHTTRSMNEATYFGGKGTKRDENNEKLLRASKKEMELGLWFGVRDTFTLSGASGVTQLSRGVKDILTSGTNYFDFNGMITESRLDGWLSDIYTQFPDATMLAAFMGPKVYNRIQQLVKPLIRLSPNATSYGLKINQYQGAIDLDLIRCPLFNGPYMDSMIFVLDMSYLKIVYQKTPVMEFDVTKDGGNYTTDKFYSLNTFILANERRHALGVNING